MRECADTIDATRGEVGIGLWGPSGQTAWRLAVRTASAGRALIFRRTRRRTECNRPSKLRKVVLGGNVHGGGCGGKKGRPPPPPHGASAAPRFTRTRPVRRHSGL